MYKLSQDFYKKTDKKDSAVLTFLSECTIIKDSINSVTADLIAIKKIIFFI